MLVVYAARPPRRCCTRGSCASGASWRSAGFRDELDDARPSSPQPRRVTCPIRPPTPETDRGAGRRRQPPSCRRPTERYLNRELSWLDFNDRVAAARRGRAACRCSSGSSSWRSTTRTSTSSSWSAWRACTTRSTPASTRRAPTASTRSTTIDAHHERVAGAGRPQRVDCGRNGSSPRSPSTASASCSARSASGPELEAIDSVFEDQIFPALTPLAVGPGRPFPYISNLSLSLAVWLRDPDTGDETFARVKVPKEVLPRFVRGQRDHARPARVGDRAQPARAVPGHGGRSHYDVFRVTRDADFTVSDEADDLVRAVENELRRRRFGEVVRLEVGAGMDDDLREKLIEWLDIEERQVYDVRRPDRPRRPVGDLRPSTATASCATRRGRRSRRPASTPSPASGPTSSPRSAPATCSSTTRTTRSRRASSASSSRRSTTPTCWRSR